MLDLPAGPSSEILWKLDIRDLDSVASAGNKVFGFDGENLLPIEVRADGYYKLVPNIFRPHPLRSTALKCTGLRTLILWRMPGLRRNLWSGPVIMYWTPAGGWGYSALFAVKAGAKQVVSTEKSHSVIRIRQQNPWLYPGARAWQTSEIMDRIQLENVDINGFIKTLPDGSFDAVIHDPPRFCSATGDLYGKVFYTQLARVMRVGARLFPLYRQPQKDKTPGPVYKKRHETP